MCLSGLLICLQRSIFIRRGDLRSPAGEHSSPLPCIGERFCNFSANFTRRWSPAFLFFKIKGDIECALVAVKGVGVADVVAVVFI